LKKSKNIMFGNALVSLLEARGKDTGRERTGGASVCVCPECGKEVRHKRSTPCNKLMCFDCKVPLTGKGAVGEIKK